MQIKTDQYKAKLLSYSQRLTDVRFVGQVIFAGIVLLVTWSGVKSVQSNYALQKQISGLKQQIAVQQLQNKNLELQNTYLDSNQYLELAARRNFGLAAPGEKEIVVPQTVALSYTVDLPKPATAPEAKPEVPTYQKNFQSWVDFFLHRQN